jgi:ferredoxin--NADP+ reductase
MDVLKHLKATVTRRVEITSHLWIVRVRPDVKVSFLPGQYFTIGLPTESKLIERPYSVASSPGDPELEFFLQVVPEGKLSPQLHEIPVGGEVYLRPAAKGRFTFDEQSGRLNHFMVATVTGLAPYLSIVRHLISREKSGEPMPYRIAILHSASTSAELAYDEELAGYAGQKAWLEYIPTISRIWVDQGWQGERGRVEDVARKHLDSLGFDASSTTVYLCGNPNMIRIMDGILERSGFEKGSVKRELYWPAD